METVSRRRLWLEIVVVLGLSFGKSGVVALVDLIDRLTRPHHTLASQSTTIVQPLSDRPVFDLAYQLLSFTFALVPVALVLLLLWQPPTPPFSRLGFTRQRFGRQLLQGVGLAALIGVPGLGLYALSSVLGINLKLVPTSLDTHWWTLPVLVLTAVRAALSEEIIVIGYLFTRLRELQVHPWVMLVGCAILRGSYHLYQGFGGAIGNMLMGLVFGWVYLRIKKIWPLIIAHLLLDIFSFVGYYALTQLNIW